MTSQEVWNTCKENQSLYRWWDERLGWSRGRALGWLGSQRRKKGSNSLSLRPLRSRGQTYRRDLWCWLDGQDQLSALLKLQGFRSAFHQVSATMSIKKAKETNLRLIGVRFTKTSLQTDQEAGLAHTDSKVVLRKISLKGLSIRYALPFGGFFG